MRYILIILMACGFITSNAQGLPFIRNYSAAEYSGHNQNFDIFAGDHGRVYVANFEGLLYYDMATWRIINTPGITRITSVFRDSKGTLWTGGYNYIGYLTIMKNGSISLHSINNNSIFSGEVTWIWEKNGKIFFLLSDHQVYGIEGEHITHATKENLPERAPYQYDIQFRQIEYLDDGMKALVTDGDGIVIIDNAGNKLYSITEENGLCSNNISHVSYDKNGLLWGATDKGVFVIQIPSVYTHFGQGEGLYGEVFAMERLGSTIYVGTSDGLYYHKDKRFVQIPHVTHACWQLKKQNENLLAATANGVYQIHSNGSIQQLTTSNTTAVMAEGADIYCGEMDGFYLHDAHGSHKVCEAEKVVKILKDSTGCIWLQNLYGRVWKKEPGKSFVQQVMNHNDEQVTTLVEYNGTVLPVSSNAVKPFPYPLFSYSDEDQNTWLTDNKGRNLYCFRKGVKQNFFSSLVYPLMDYSVSTMLVNKRYIWMGGDKGINVIDCSRKDPLQSRKPQLYIRSIFLHGDSVLWGGYGTMPNKIDALSPNDRHLIINYSIYHSSLLLLTQYRYRLNGGKWSAWDVDTSTEYNDMAYGNHVFEVQARDAFGQLSNIVSIQFYISHPFYMRWYMIILYILLAGLMIYLLLQLRLRRLERETLRLEHIVQDRTAEIVKQKDEIEEKSKSLETALHELGEAQHELVRQEKMATVGKLTQGLIDRILNPLNYINNFSKLSESLVQDVKVNIEDEKEHINEENYEDTIDILGMLKGNLEKVSEHGQNTTRTLKAMEEMLKDRSGGLMKVNLLSLIQQNREMTDKYFMKEIADHHIQITYQHPEGELFVKANPEELSRCFMSLLSNAIYAVVKKAKREKFIPEIRLAVEKEDHLVRFLLRDNGIGIEETIINKIFDPFFTTKTTGEAAGIGLYLSREIIQNCGGDISVHSEKNVFTEFTITIPTL